MSDTEKNCAMFTSSVTPELLSAIAEAQGEIENATKNSNNPHYKSKYADLAEIINTVREVYPKHGLSITQAPHFDGSLCSVTTMLAHKSGGYILSTASCVPAKYDAQGIGSATTYLRRYAMAAMAGIAQEDDDGNSAAHDRKPEPLRKPASAPAPKPEVDQNHPNVLRLKELRGKIVEDAGARGGDSIPDSTKWANGLIKEAADSFQLSLKPGALERISEGAMEQLVVRVMDMANEKLNGVANA